MKSIVILLGFCAIIYGQVHDNEKQKLQEEYVKFVGECGYQFKMNITQLSNSQSTDNSLKCYGNCIAEKLGILKNGVLQRDNTIRRLMAHYNKEEAETIIDACRVVQGEDYCDTAFQLYQCYMKYKPF